jgi:predicted esterase
MEQSIQHVLAHIDKHGPYDGLVGFSQGAALVTILCMLNCCPDVRFVMLFGGYPATQHLPLQQDNHFFTDIFSKYAKGSVMLNGGQLIDMPSLHVWGTADVQVPSENSLALSKLYKDPVVHIHDGGHFIPTMPECRILYRDFVRTHQERSVHISQTRMHADRSRQNHVA